jgi:Amt family ammonium transporter
MAGTWGAIATGIFASKAINPAGADGLLHGNAHLLLAQLTSVVAVWAFTFVGTYAIAKLIDQFMNFTASEYEQEQGLDLFHLSDVGLAEPEAVEAAAAEASDLVKAS